MSNGIIMIIFKVVLCGDGGVGKTSLRRKYLGEGFRMDYIATMGVDIAKTTITLPNGKKCSIAIWDIAGQEIFQQLRPNFYDGASGAFILYDITGLKTYESVLNWADEIFQEFHDPKNFPIILIANKSDLREEAGIIEKNKGIELAKSVSEKYYHDNWKVPIIETSAKTGKNVEKAFLTMADSIMKMNEKLSD